MQRATYVPLDNLGRRSTKGGVLSISLPGDRLDFPALDAEAKRQHGNSIVRVASWLTEETQHGSKQAKRRAS